MNAIKDFVAISYFGYVGITENDDPRLVGAMMRNRNTALTAITDGTSNTILVAEDAGRPLFYNQARQVYNPNGQHGGWAYPGGAFSIDGANPNGTIPGGCSMNCSNDSEIYSFHTSGPTSCSPTGPATSSGTPSTCVPWRSW